MASKCKTGKAGAWTQEDHERLYPSNFDFGLAQFLVDNLSPKRALEFGSGVGDLARYLTKSGAEMHCIEPVLNDENYDAVRGPVLHQVDIFSEPLPSSLPRHFDTVISIEVAEHIPRSLHGFLFDFMTSRSTRWIAFSGAIPGQGGYGHVAERPESEWRTEFESRGWQHYEELTVALRRACDEKNVNHRRNAMIFRKPD